MEMGEHNVMIMLVEEDKFMFSCLSRFLVPFSFYFPSSIDNLVGIQNQT